ncbi:MAG: histidinol dehydrogenase, partial [Chitinophagaceae bacterium]
MKLYKYPVRENWAQILERPAFEAEKLEKKVSKIIKKVRKKGDAAIKKLTAKFDGVQLQQLLVSEEEVLAAEAA